MRESKIEYHLRVGAVEFTAVKESGMLRRLIIMAALLIVVVGTAPYTPVHALQSNSAPLETLLGKVPDNQISRTEIWYGSLSDLEQALDIQLSSLADFKGL